MEGGSFSFLVGSPESSALPQGDMQCHFLSRRCRFLKKLSDWPRCARDSLCAPHLPSEQSGRAPFAARCLSECSFSQLASHHLGITPVPVLNHVILKLPLEDRNEMKRSTGILFSLLLSPGADSTRPNGMLTWFLKSDKDEQVQLAFLVST